MKRILLIAIAMLCTSMCFAQTTPIDTLAYEDGDYMRLAYVDSLMDEGMYMSALMLLDSIEVQRKNYLGKEPTFMMFFTRCRIYIQTEEPEALVSTAEKFFAIHTGFNLYQDILYAMQANAYNQLGKYKKAIQAYENAISTNRFKDGREGTYYCNIASCYLFMKKNNIAEKFFEKGFEILYGYLETTKEELLRKKVRVEPRKETILSLMGTHLHQMAYLQKEKGNYAKHKEYLLMSSNAGNEDATKEYKRLYQ
jgi:tetratricopeptide (TPR) repeat protein